MRNRDRLTGLLLPVVSLHAIGAALLGIFVVSIGAPGAEAKTPGSKYCFYGVCHRVKTLSETSALVGREEEMHASFYDSCKVDRYNPCGLTSSGERFHPDRADNAASPIYPDGTTLLVRNPANQETAVVRVNNAGPYWGKRKLDVSRATAEKLGFKKRGVAKLEVTVLKAPQPSEARYRRNRSYEKVPGYLGKFADTGSARAGLTALMVLEDVATALLGPLKPSTAVAVQALPASPEETLVGAASRPAAPVVKVAAVSRNAIRSRTVSRSSRATSRVAVASRKAAKAQRYASRKANTGVTKVAQRKVPAKSGVAVAAIAKLPAGKATAVRRDTRVASVEQVTMRNIMGGRS